MKIWVKSGIIIIALILEMILANFLSHHIVKPDLVLIVVICFSFISGSEEGVVTGFAGGLLKDIFSIHLLGMNAMVKTIIGYISGIIKDRIFYQHLIWMVTISAFIFTILNNIIIYYLLHALHANYDFMILLKKVTLIQAMMNSIIAPFIFTGIKNTMSYFQHRG